MVDVQCSGECNQFLESSVAIIQVTCQTEGICKGLVDFLCCRNLFSIYMVQVFLYLSKHTSEYWEGNSHVVQLAQYLVPLVYGYRFLVRGTADRITLKQAYI